MGYSQKDRKQMLLDKADQSRKALVEALDRFLDINMEQACDAVALAVSLCDQGELLNNEQSLGIWKSFAQFHDTAAFFREVLKGEAIIAQITETGPCDSIH